MKTYDNAFLKRAIQKHLWTNIAECNNVLALSSPQYVPEYIKCLPTHKNLYLVNFAPESKVINANSLIGLFDILLYRNQIPTFIDADFCKTIHSCGDDLVYIYNKCKKLNRDITISFTFSIRGVGLDYTLKWLREHFNVNVNNYIGLPILEEYYNYRQFCIEYGNCIHYRDSGDQMITGLIRIKKKDDTKRSHNHSKEV
jgi:hypothetical protein